MSKRALWRRVAGPALLLAVAASAAILGRQTPPSRPARVALPESPIGLVPEPGWLARRGAEIPLTAEQSRQARAAAAAWDRDTADDRAQLARLGAALDGQRRLDPARQSEFAERSARLAARRHDDWDRAWATLTEAQRQRIRQLRAAARLEMR